MIRAAGASLALLLAACGATPAATPSSPARAQSIPPRTGGAAVATPTPAPATTAIVELARGGSFTIQLRVDKAPATVARFAAKARSGFYDGLTFHRVEDWVVQGGDPLGTGTGGERVPSEYNDLPFRTGAVGIARGQDPAVNNGSQWFVVKKDSTFLDRQYTNFGTVTSGLDVVLGIAIGDRIKTIRVQ